jgi:hypothetical protein
MVSHKIAIHPAFRQISSKTASSRLNLQRIPNFIRLLVRQHHRQSAGVVLEGNASLAAEQFNPPDRFRIGRGAGLILEQQLSEPVKALAPGLPFAGGAEGLVVDVFDAGGVEGGAECLVVIIVISKVLISRCYSIQH